MVNRSQGRVSKGKVSGRKEALISHVVDGEDCGHVAEGWVFGVLGAQQDGDERGLPVVAVKNLGHAKNFRSLQHGAGKQSKALGVVGIIAGGSPVKRIAIKKRGILDKVEIDSGALAAADHGTEAVAVIERYGDAFDHGPSILEQGLAVAGKIDAHLVSGRNQGPRQRTHYVGQSARLGEWHTLRGRKNDVHRRLLIKCRPGAAGTRYHRVLLTAYSAARATGRTNSPV